MKVTDSNPHARASGSSPRFAREQGRIAPEAVRGAGSRRVAVAGIVGLALATTVLMWAGRDLIFLQDEWNVIEWRLDYTADAYLKPHNEHLLLIPVALYKLLLETVGIAEYWPYRLMVVVAHLTCVCLFYFVARRSVGRTAAWFVSLPLVFLGAAWEVVLWPFNVQWCISVGALLGLLLLLDRRDHRAEVGCAALIAVALSSSSLGVAIAIGVIVEVMWQPDRWRRIWIPLAPLALYGAWFVGYNQHPNYQGPRDFPPSPRYVFDAAAGGVGAFLGLPLAGETTGRLHRLLVGAVDLLTAIAAIGLAWTAAVRRSLTARQAMLIALATFNWVALAYSRSFAAPWSSRYVYGGAFVVALIGLEFARGRELGRRTRAVLVLVCCTAAALNLIWLVDNAGPRREDSKRLRAQLGALELLRDSVPTTFEPVADPLGGQIIAGPYFRAVDRIGRSPALSAREILESPEYARVAADQVLLRATPHPLLAYTDRSRKLIDEQLAAADRVRSAPKRCSTAKPAGGVPASIVATSPPEGLLLRAGPPGAAPVSVRRFARTFRSRAVGRIGTQPRWLALPVGGSRIPWHAKLTSGRAFRLVEAGSGQILVTSAGAVAICPVPGPNIAPLAGDSTGAVSVVRGAVPGYVDSQSIRGRVLSVAGWATTRGTGPADEILVFAGSRLLIRAQPSILRQDIAAEYGAAAGVAGFVASGTLPFERRNGKRPRIRVFAVAGERASELPGVGNP